METNLQAARRWLTHRNDKAFGGQDWVAASIHAILTHLESQSKAMDQELAALGKEGGAYNVLSTRITRKETPPSLPATMLREATPPGNSISLPMCFLVREGQAGGGMIWQAPAVATFLGPHFFQIPGDVLRLWQDEPSALLVLSMSESPLPSGPTPSQTPGAAAVGQSADTSVAGNAYVPIDPHPIHIPIGHACTCPEGFPKVDEVSGKRWLRHSGACHLADSEEK